MTEELLGELAGDSLERLKWLVCRELGIPPGSLAWYSMTARRVIRYACHLALDVRERGFSAGDGAERETAEGFDLERFRELGGEL
ncbi:MAG: hypothetical protein NC319_09195 [Butyricicoccus sp.]|nr:hypothetical protein [Butyricicoccus sp.]